MASSSRQKQKNKGKLTAFQGVLEGWFAGNEEGINAYIHETSKKKINIPKVLDFELAEIWKTGRNKGCVEAPETEKAAGING